MDGIIYNDGDEIIIHRNYVEKFFRYNEAQIEDEETRNYVIESDNCILKKIINMNDEYIGLSVHPMDDCFFINQNLLKVMGE